MIWPDALRMARSRDPVSYVTCNAFSCTVESGVKLKEYIFVLSKPAKSNWTLLSCAEEEEEAEVVLRPEIIHKATEMRKMKEEEEEEEEEAITVRSL